MTKFGNKVMSRFLASTLKWWVPSGRWALGLAVVLLAPAIALATPVYSGLYVFGDSLSDTGNLYFATGNGLLPGPQDPVSPPYDDGRFSNGPLWVEDLAARLGLGPVVPSLKGGTDFAFGGAQTGVTPANPAPGRPIDLTAQVAAFQKAIVAPSPDALYTMWIGSNDVDALIGGLLTGALKQSEIPLDVAAAVGNVVGAVGGLAGGGMQYLLALNVPDLSKTPQAMAAAEAADPTDPDAVLAEIQQLTQSFNGLLEPTLVGLSKKDDFHLSLVNTYAELDEVVADPGRYGFSNVTDPCWTGTDTYAGSGQVCSDPDGYLFWDDLHPTAAGHQLLAEAAYQALAVPEPAVAGMFGFGLLLVGALVALRRRECKLFE